MTLPLDRDIRNVARAWAEASGGQYDADDIVQHLYELLLTPERQKFLEQPTRHRTIRRLNWMASHLAEKGRTYRRYCPEMPLVEDDGLQVELYECVADPSESPEEALIAREERQAEIDAAKARLSALLPRLPARQARLLVLLMQGHAKSTAAKRMRCSKANVSMLWNRVVRTACG